MRAQTPSYVISTKVQFPESIAKLLEKSFRISNSAYNEALSFDSSVLKPSSKTPIIKNC